MQANNDRRRTGRLIAFESLSTAQLLAHHEKYFGAVDARSKPRILEGALRRGWDRSWDDALLAA